MTNLALPTTGSSWKTPLATAAPTDEVARTPAPPPALKSSSNAATAAKRKQQTSPATPAPSGPPKTPSHDVNGGPMTLTELAVPLRSRIWDLTDGRLVNGEWTRYDWKPNSDLKILEPFGGTVAEFETAMRTELDLPEREAPGVQFIKMIAEHEKYRDAHRKATKSAPVVGLFGGSLTGVTAQMWEVQDTEGRTRREFSDGRDAEAYVRKNVEIKVTKMTNKIKAAAAFTSTISEDQPGGKELRDAAKAAVSAAAKEEAAAAASSASTGSSGLKSNVVTHKVWTKYCAFDSEAAIAVAAARHTLTRARAFGHEFIVVMQVYNPKMLDMTKSWLCNTRHMRGVHSSTLIIADSITHRKLFAFQRDAFEALKAYAEKNNTTLTEAATKAILDQLK